MPSNSNKKQVDRHKTVMCNVCTKSMLSNNLKRHMKVHVDITDLKDDESIRVEIKKRKLAQEQQEKQLEKVKRIAKEENASPLTYEQSFPSTSKVITDLHDELTSYNELYLQKVDLGEKIDHELSAGTVVEDALPKTYVEALDLFRKGRKPINIGNVELRPWQQELLEKIKTPTEREVIWVKGIKGNKGKT